MGPRRFFGSSGERSSDASMASSVGGAASKETVPLASMMTRCARSAVSVWRVATTTVHPASATARSSPTSSSTSWAGRTGGSVTRNASAPDTMARATVALKRSNGASSAGRASTLVRRPVSSSAPTRLSQSATDPVAASGARMFCRIVRSLSRVSRAPSRATAPMRPAHRWRAERGLADTTRPESGSSRPASTRNKARERRPDGSSTAVIRRARKATSTPSSRGAPDDGSL